MTKSGKELIGDGSKLLEDHRKENKEILTRHFYDMSNMMSGNEGVWLANGWVKALDILAVFPLYGHFDCLSCRIIHRQIKKSVMALYRNNVVTLFIYNSGNYLFASTILAILTLTSYSRYNG